MTKDFLRLQEIDLEATSDKLIPILIGTEMTELHLNREARFRDKDRSVGLSTTLGWVLMGGKSKTNISGSDTLFNFF